MQLAQLACLGLAHIGCCNAPQLEGFVAGATALEDSIGGRVREERWHRQEMERGVWLCT